MASLSSPASPRLPVQSLKTQNPLFQHDLFHCILDCFAAPEVKMSLIFQPSELQHVLVSLALTCRTLSELSLDRLWSKLDSLEPLIRCYVPALDKEKAKRPPSATEWAVIHRYSHRIKELEIHPLCEFTPYFLQATGLHPSFLLPNLRVLKWHPGVLLESGSRLSIMFIQRLLSPSLVSLSITLTEANDAALESFLTYHHSLCPNLKSISINLLECQDIPDETTKFLSRSITRYGHLECLDISAPIDNVAFLHVALSPKLRKICLMSHPDKSNLRHVLIPSDAVPFRNVEELTLEVWDLHFAMSLLRTRVQVFRTFAISYHSQPTVDGVHAFVTSLASNQLAYSLHSIHLTPTGEATSTELAQSSPHHYLTYETFRPLSSLCHLRELVVDLCYWPSLDDDDLVTLIRNWPSLQVLQLNRRSHLHEFPWRWSKYVTLKGLLSLLECCPDLQRLSLPVDARVVPINTGHVICNPALTGIHFPESPINDTWLVHKFLARHFPSVMRVTTYFHQTLDDDDVELTAYLRSWTAIHQIVLHEFLLSMQNPPKKEEKVALSPSKA